jgi:hypothetical protein
VKARRVFWIERKPFWLRKYNSPATKENFRKNLRTFM